MEFLETTALMWSKHNNFKDKKKFKAIHSISSSSSNLWYTTFNQMYLHIRMLPATSNGQVVYLCSKSIHNLRLYNNHIHTHQFHNTLIQPNNNSSNILQIIHSKSSHKFKQTKYLHKQTATFNKSNPWI